jgi:hypothetical protein
MKSKAPQGRRNPNASAKFVGAARMRQLLECGSTAAAFDCKRFGESPARHP